MYHPHKFICLFQNIYNILFHNILAKVHSQYILLYFKFIIQNSSYTNDNQISVIMLVPSASAVCSADLFFFDLLAFTSVQV